MFSYSSDLNGDLATMKTPNLYSTKNPTKKPLKCGIKKAQMYDCVWMHINRMEGLEKYFQKGHNNGFVFKTFYTTLLISVEIKLIELLDTILINCSPVFFN